MRENVQPVIAALPKAREKSAAPKTGHCAFRSPFCIDDFRISWRSLTQPSHRNAFMKNVIFFALFMWEKKFGCRSAASFESNFTYR